jgi:hypothetical protein
VRDRFRVEPYRCGGIFFLEIEMYNSPKYGNILSRDEKKDTITCKRNFPNVYGLCRKAQNDSSNSYQKVNSSIGGRNYNCPLVDYQEKMLKEKYCIPWCNV